MVSIVQDVSGFADRTNTRTKKRDPNRSRDSAGSPIAPSAPPGCKDSSTQTWETYSVSQQRASAGDPYETLHNDAFNDYLVPRAKRGEAKKEVGDGILKQRELYLQEQEREQEEARNRKLESQRVSFCDLTEQDDLEFLGERFNRVFAEKHCRSKFDDDENFSSDEEGTGAEKKLWDDVEAGLKRRKELNEGMWGMTKDNYERGKWEADAYALASEDKERELDSDSREHSSDYRRDKGGYRSNFEEKYSDSSSDSPRRRRRLGSEGINSPRRYG